jgi:hypothetical protein
MAGRAAAPIDDFYAFGYNSTNPVNDRSQRLVCGLFGK